MIKHSFLKSILLALTIVFFASCDNDFNELGADIVGIDNFDMGTPDTYGIAATNVDVGAVETTNLPVNPLGIYDNPVYGETVANFATQLELAEENPTIDLSLHPVIEKVILTIPYFSTTKTTYTTTTAGTYELDSIYGPNPADTKMKLSVFESKYYIRNVNPQDQLPQAYYSDQAADFESTIDTPRLNDDNSKPAQNDAFFFSNIENIVYTYAADGTPSEASRNVAMVMDLSKTFFDQKIFHAPAGKLLNNNIFKDYFRGLYFKVEKLPGQKGNLAMLNFAGGDIKILYKHDKSATDITQEYTTLKLNLKGNTVSLINQGNPYVTQDNSKIYLKGGANNSMAVVDLFTDGKLAEARAHNWLINDATLTFTVDNTANGMGKTASDGTKADEPMRLYLYDLTNKRPLVDYSVDQTSSGTSKKFNKYNFGGILEKGADGRGKQYRIKLTRHVIRMLTQDSTNVRLGLVVTEDINTSTNKRTRNQNLLSGKLKVVPAMSVAHPLGTILYGSVPEGSPDYDKRPKFEVYYTKPK